MFARATLPMFLSGSQRAGRKAVPHSVLDAIRQGVWDFEPEDVLLNQYGETEALPGSDAKLEVLADRVKDGLPLWHPSDRLCYASED